MDPFVYALILIALCISLITGYSNAIVLVYRTEGTSHNAADMFFKTLVSTALMTTAIAELPVTSHTIQTVMLIVLGCLGWLVACSYFFVRVLRKKKRRNI